MCTNMRQHNVDVVFSINQVGAVGQNVWYCVAAVFDNAATENLKAQTATVRLYLKSANGNLQTITPQTGQGDLGM